jgi:hypothetical protein
MPTEPVAPTSFACGLLAVRGINSMDCFAGMLQVLAANVSLQDIIDMLTVKLVKLGSEGDCLIPWPT